MRLSFYAHKYVLAAELFHIYLEPMSGIEPETSSFASTFSPCHAEKG